MTEEQRQRKNELARIRYHEKLKFDESYMEVRRKRSNDLRRNKPEEKKERDRLHYLANKEKIQEQARASYKRQREENPVRVMLLKIKNRAKHEGIAFNLELEDIELPTHCPILGIPLIFAHEDRNHWPSVDKINPELGYVKGNIAVISFRANKIKNDATWQELLAIGNWLKNQTMVD